MWDNDLERGRIRLMQQRIERIRKQRGFCTTMNRIACDDDDNRKFRMRFSAHAMQIADARASRLEGCRVAS